MANLKDKVKGIVEHFHRSTSATEKLEFLQQQMKPNQEVLKLKNDIVTRWNSTYNMCRHMCAIQEPLEATIAVLHCPVSPLTDENWAALKEVCSILKTFDAVTKEVSAEKNVFISKEIMLAHALVSACNKIQPTTEAAKTLANTNSEEMQKRFGGLEHNLLLARATFLVIKKE